VEPPGSLRLCSWPPSLVPVPGERQFHIHDIARIHLRSPGRNNHKPSLPDFHEYILPRVKIQLQDPFAEKQPSPSSDKKSLVEILVMLKSFQTYPI
jgi:hypothetical protein